MKNPAAQNNIDVSSKRKLLTTINITWKIFIGSKEVASIFDFVFPPNNM